MTWLVLLALVGGLIQVLTLGYAPGVSAPLPNTMPSPGWEGYDPPLSNR